jgi:HD-GYP domain-containing protein (c-di-GMP phosphodiesterase class II)
MSEILSKQGWPDSFNFDTDPVCQSVFKPFIEQEMAALKAYDAQRPAGHTYIFPEHAERVAGNIRKTCLHMGLGDNVATNMYWAVLPHDIGKRQLPLDIWDREEKPTSVEKKFRRTHTILGAQIVEEYFSHIEHPFKDLLRDIMLYHHEQMDCEGTLGVDAAGLSAPVRLAAIVEAYDGWRIWRPHYAERDISPAGVLKRMREEKGAEVFDMDLFTAFEEMKLKEIGT